jgi:predicted PurR-regulated permease PerM
VFDGRHFYICIKTRMVRALKILDILVIIILVLIAAALIYIFWPLIVAIIIMAVGYFTYRWYMRRKRLG